jgi:hypothetical protein
MTCRVQLAGRRLTCNAPRFAETVYEQRSRRAHCGRRGRLGRQRIEG